jgi:NAD-dependent dihydropyrimidine dehydrogenase PreA subunit/flavodoxin
LFTFSGTGNTWWVARQIAAALNQQGITAEAFSIEKLSREEIEDLVHRADTIGIGYPIYASDAPLLVQDFVHNLPISEPPKPALVFVTQMEWSGNGAWLLHHSLESRGYRVRWAVEFKMPNNIGMHIFPVPSTPNFTKFTPKLAKATNRARRLAESIAAEQEWIQGKGVINNALSLLQRLPWRLALKWTQTHTWSVDAEKCTRCGRCERICPVENIKLDPGGLPIWSDQCNLCLRCFNYCPEQAILVYKKPFDPKRNGGQPYHGPVPEFKPELLARKK